MGAARSSIQPCSTQILSGQSAASTRMSAVFLDTVVVPHLLLSPGHILHVENDTMIGDFTILNIIPRQYVVILHLEMSAIIVETLAGIPVVAGINEELAVKHIG